MPWACCKSCSLEARRAIARAKMRLCIAACTAALTHAHTQRTAGERLCNMVSLPPPSTTRVFRAPGGEALSHLHSCKGRASHNARCSFLSWTTARARRPHSPRLRSLLRRPKRPHQLTLRRHQALRWSEICVAPRWASCSGFAASCRLRTSTRQRLAESPHTFRDLGLPSPTGSKTACLLPWREVSSAALASLVPPTPEMLYANCNCLSVSALRPRESQAFCVPSC